MKTKCQKCGCFARRSIIGTICHHCIARERGFKTRDAWITASLAAAEEAARRGDI